MAESRSIYYSDYEKYESLKGDDTKTAAQKIRDEVGVVQGQLSILTVQLSDWKGDSKSSFDSFSTLLLQDINNIQDAIANNLEPACQAVEELVPLLDNLKTKDKEVVDAKDKYEGLQNNEPPLDTTTYYDKNGNEVDSAVEGGTSKTTTAHSEWETEFNAAKDDYETKLAQLDELKAQCDALIATINSLQSAVNSFNNFKTTAQEKGIDLSSLKDLSDMTYEEKEAFLQALVDGYKEIYDDLKAYYNKHYKDGLPLEYADMQNLLPLFDSFFVYEMLGVVSNFDVLCNVDAFAAVMKFCEDNKFFEKLMAYSGYPDGNGVSWEESGLAELYRGRNGENDYTEQDILDKLWYYQGKNQLGITSEDATYIELCRGEGNEANRTKFLQQYLKQNLNTFMESFNKVSTIYSDYSNTVIAANLVKALYGETNRCLYLLPCIDKLGDEGYAAFVEKYKNNLEYYENYSLETLLSKEQYNEFSILLGTDAFGEQEAAKYLQNILEISEDKAYLYIHNYEYKSNGINAELFVGGGKYNKTFGDYMTQEEKQLYYYLGVELGDPELAQRYLDGMHNEFNKRYAQDITYDFINDNYYKPEAELFWNSFIDGEGDGIQRIGLLL